MQTTIIVNSSDPMAQYVGWSPSPCQISLSDATGATDAVTVLLSNISMSTGGQLVFSSASTGTFTDTLTVTLPIDGTSVLFFLSGKFGYPSIDDKDACVQAADAANATVYSTTRLMVRVRKDANSLSTSERDRFVSALATLNNKGLGKFSDFRDMHTSIALPEAHGNDGFLSWHRAYLVDLERSLQNIDSSVTIPYWKFDDPAPSLFTQDFIGVSDSSGAVQFSENNPLLFWKTDQDSGINRGPKFDTGTDAAHSPGNVLLTELQTLNIGTVFADFTTLEGNPHGSAHVSFSGYISDPATAPKDPIFFLLHANVDRLWAKWQWVNKRFDATSTDTFPFQGSAGDPGATRIGHNLNDTMWPWNQDITPPRPSTAPGGGMGPSPIASAPGTQPTVGNLIDYQGVITAANRILVDYDDVPYAP